MMKTFRHPSTRRNMSDPRLPYCYAPIIAEQEVYRHIHSEICALECLHCLKFDTCLGKYLNGDYAYLAKEDI